MKGYLSPLGTEGGSVKVESRTEIYRSSDDTEEILVETGGRTLSTGVSDVTVSRKKGGEAPIVIEPGREFIGIRNAGNANGITVRTRDEETEVEEGHLVNVSRDAELVLGFNAAFELVVERDARVEVVNQGDGDVVLGDQRNVDNSTTVGDDNVVNRSDIGGDEPGSGEIGDDNVVNRSRVGGDDRALEGEATGDDTRFCTECGTELPAGAVACFACGAPLEPDGGAEGETRGYCERHQRTYSGETCPVCRDGQ
jgi:hypothetical protein